MVNNGKQGPTTIGGNLILVCAVCLVGCVDKQRTSRIQAETRPGPGPSPDVGEITLEEFPGWLKKHLSRCRWGKRTAERRLSRAMLHDSFELGLQA